MYYGVTYPLEGVKIFNEGNTVCTRPCECFKGSNSCTSTSRTQQLSFSVYSLSEQSSYGQPGKLPRNFCKTCGIPSMQCCLLSYVRNNAKRRLEQESWSSSKCTTPFRFPGHLWMRHRNRSHIIGPRPGPWKDCQKIIFQCTSRRRLLICTW
jgi:hypothetical protein